MDDLLEQLTQSAVSAADSGWVYPVVFVVTVLDAFLVVVPSETVIVALGALSVSAGAPSLPVLIPVAAVAAMLGDSLTYAAGRALGSSGPRWLRRPRVRRMLLWARRALDRRAAAVLLTARFIPFGRIAVNLSAGASGFPYRRFAGLTAFAAFCWAGYNVAVGALFGAVFEQQPLYAVGVSIVVAVVLGVALDAASSRWHRRHTATRGSDSGQAADSPPG